MAFPAQFIDEVRARVGLADVVGRRVKLTRRGREHSGLCPFHNEKTPSFTLNEDKGFFHCFGCGKHGSVFDFVMETEGLSFPESVEKLAQEAGMQIPVQSPQAAERAEAQAGLIGVMEQAAKFFENQLAGEGGKSARAYLRDRGVGKAAMGGFRLGLGPNNRTALKQYMLTREVPEDQLVEAGLLIRPDDGGDTYDRFRDRLMFPITDPRGRVIAFGGRALGEARAKYLNSPETPLFHKGRVLYNYANARAAARTSPQVIVAEGYMDVIALHEGGFACAVAPLGTAVTEDQLLALWKISPEPVFCLDGDQAGWKAAIRAAERALPILKPGHSLRFARLPEGDDPDTMVRERGKEAMQVLLDDALPLSEVLWRKFADGQVLDTPERRAGFRRDLFDEVRTIADPSVRGFYEQHFTQRMDDAFGRKSGGRGRGRGGKGDFARGGRGKASGLEQRLGRNLALNDPAAKRIGLLLATLLNHPAMIEGAVDELVGLEISNSELDRLRAEIIDIAGRGAPLEISALRAQLTERGLAAAVDRLTGNKATKIERFARPEATLEEAEAGWKALLALDHRNVGLVQQRREYAGTEAAENDDRLVRGMQQVLDEEQNLATDQGRD